MEDRLFILIILLSFLFCGCAKNNNSVISLDKDLIELNSGVDTKTFMIETKNSWKIKADGLEGWYGPNKASSSWFEISPIFGTGTAKISITTFEGTSGNQIELNIVSEGKTRIVKLIQE